MAPRSNARNQPFQQSSELKHTFNELSDTWCKKHRLGLADLAERCGVSLQYLSHIGRYGRIPAKPILTLLALNLDVRKPSELYRMAGLRDSWPYEEGIGLRERAATDSGLLSINLDMNGFTNAIREIVRAEIHPKRLTELLKGRPLRVGLNRGQFFLFDGKGSKAEGFFPELIRAVALALHADIEFVEVSHASLISKLESGEIDLFGPVYRTSRRFSHVPFTRPFLSIELMGLVRTKRIGALAMLSPPKRVSELRREPYIIAVHRDSMAHHFAEVELGIEPERLVLCDVAEEAVERLILTNIPRPAHVMLTDAPFAVKAQKENAAAIELVFEESDPDAPPFEDAIAIRPDWPSVVSVFDDAIELLRRGGTLKRMYEMKVDILQAPRAALIAA